MAWGTKWEHVECPVLTFMLIRSTLLFYPLPRTLDSDNNGYLDFTEFLLAMDLVAARCPFSLDF